MKKILRSFFCIFLFVLPMHLLAQTAPTTQAINVNFVGTGTGLTATIGWTNGNGAGRGVFVKAGNSGAPTLGTSAITASTVFGSGGTAGTGWYCVYFGTGTTVNITGLTANTQYITAVVEYNSSGTTYAYSTATGTNNPQVSSSVAAPTNIFAAGISATSFSMDWIANTTATGGYVYDVTTTSDPNFASPVLSNVAVAQPSTVAVSTNVTGLTANTSYLFRIKSYNTSSGFYSGYVSGGTVVPSSNSASTSITTLTGTNFTAAYDFNGIPSTAITGSTDPTPVPVVGSSTVVSLGSFSVSGAVPSAGVGRFAANNWGNSVGAPIDITKYYSVTVSPGSSGTLKLSSFVFTTQRSGTGPQSYSVRSSLDGYASNITTVALNNISAAANITVTGGVFTETSTYTTSTYGNTVYLPSATYGSLSSAVTFRIYAYNDQSAGTTGTFSVDNVNFISQSDNTLTALTISAGTLSPTFASTTTAYTASVPYATSSITVTPTQNDPASTITVNGTAVASGTASASINLNVGNNVIPVVVTAGDNTTTTYNLTITRNPVTYYSQATGDLSTLATYTSDGTSTGTPAPDFNGGGSAAVYQLANRSTYTLAANLVLGSNATLNIPTGATLDLAGNSLSLYTLAGSGTLTGSSASSLTVNGTVSSLAFATGKGLLANLILGANANVTLASPLSIAASNGSLPGTLDLIAGGATLTTGGFLTMKSDATGSAYVKNLNGSTVSGNVTVERYLSDKRAWRLIAPSVYSTTQSINAAWQEGATSASSDPNPTYGTFLIGSSTSNGYDFAGSSSLLTYSSGSGTYSGVTNTTTVGISSFPGFFLFSIGNRSLTNVSLASTHSATTLRSTGALLGGTQNAPVNAAGFTLVGNPFICPVDFSQVTRSSTVPNSFYAWDATLNTYGGFVLVANTGSGYTVTPNTSTISTIIPTGAAIFVQSDGTTAGSLTIGESAKVTPITGNPVNFVASATPQHNFRVNLADAGSNVVDGVLASFGDSFSNKVDATDALKMTNFYENMSLKRAGKLLAMECRSSITAKDTIFVQLSGMKSAAYQLQVDPTSFNSPGMTAYLADAYLKTTTKLDLNNVSTVAFTANTADTASYKNRFSVTFVPTVDALKISHVGASVVAYPNPATNKQVNLSFDGLPTGTYNITMVDSFGHVMQKSSMVYNGTTSNKLLAANYTTGVYTVNIQSAGYNQSIKVIVP